MERGTDLFKSGFAMTKQIVKDSGTRTHNNGYLIQNNTIILGWWRIQYLQPRGRPIALQLRSDADVMFVWQNALGDNKSKTCPLVL